MGKDKIGSVGLEYMAGQLHWPSALVKKVVGDMYSLLWIQHRDNFFAKPTKYANKHNRIKALEQLVLHYGPSHQMQRLTERANGILRK